MKYLTDEQRVQGLNWEQTFRALRWARAVPDPEGRPKTARTLTQREIEAFFVGGPDRDGGSGREFLYGDLVGVGGRI